MSEEAEVLRGEAAEERGREMSNDMPLEFKVRIIQRLQLE
jgi:hypothetical protein